MGWCSSNKQLLVTATQIQGTIIKEGQSKAARQLSGAYLPLKSMTKSGKLTGVDLTSLILEFKMQPTNGRFTGPTNMTMNNPSTKKAHTCVWNDDIAMFWEGFGGSMKRRAPTIMKRIRIFCWVGSGQATLASHMLRCQDTAHFKHDPTFASPMPVSKINLARIGFLDEVVIEVHHQIRSHWFREFQDICSSCCICLLLNGNTCSHEFTGILYTGVHT